jgi:AbiV family abortive infection protein
MVSNSGNLQLSIEACIKSGKRLLEDSEWLTHRESTGIALAMLAQEEFAKAFVLALVRNGIVPWTEEVQRSLRVHECKHLVTIIMEWLSVVNEIRSNQSLEESLRKNDSLHLPPNVAIAMNIFRHEMIERIGGRSPDHYPEWGGAARRIAKGKRDRKKQAALYVDIRDDGGVASEPTMSVQEFEAEFEYAEKLMEFAGDVDRNCIFASREYEMFGNIFREMFAESSEPPEQMPFVTENYPEGIPDVVLVKRTITIADVIVDPDAKATSRVEIDEKSAIGRSL